MKEINLLTLVVVLAAGGAALAHRLKQPLLVAYLVVGMLLSAFHLVKPEELTFLALLPEVGLALLLFLVGMELDLGEFRRLGRNVLLATAGQVIATTLFLLFLLIKIGLGPPVALLFALAGSFSSTILVIKLLLEEKELSSMHGKLSIGILLTEDLLAILLLMVLAVVKGAGFTPSVFPFLFALIKGLFLFWLALFSGRRFLPRLFRFLADSGELLLIAAIGWCLVFVSLSSFLGFSLAIGSFLAGVSLAQSAYRLQISAKIKPLRDFFIFLFFLDLGTGLSLSGVGAFLPLALVLLTTAVLVKPILFFLIFSFLRLRIHSAFQTGVYLSSISEFSLIILAQGARQGLIDSRLLSPSIFATVFSFVLSSFLITHSRTLFVKIRPFLKRFERKEAYNLDLTARAGEELVNHAVLIGCHRSGEVIFPPLQKIFGDNLVVVDFNPEVIANLKDRFIPCIYGDVADPEVAEKINFRRARLVVSTVRDLRDNFFLLDHLEKIQSLAVVVMTAADQQEAIKLYERGAHYVSLPMFLEGNSIGRLISDHHQNLGELVREKERRLGELKRLNHGL